MFLSVFGFSREFCSFYILFLFLRHKRTKHAKSMKLRLCVGICGILILFSCNRGRVMPAELQQLDSLAEAEPARAMSLLDSLAEKYDNADEAEFYKYRLLCIKAKAKAYIPIDGEKQIKEIARYYMGKPLCMEQIEALYYLGGFYRDGHDYPRAIENYRAAVERAGSDKRLSQSTTVACCYAQLAGLNLKLSRMDKALEYAKKEHEIFQAICPDDIVKELDIAKTYRYCGKKDSASIYYTRALNLIAKDSARQHFSETAEILYFYSTYSRKSAADSCAAILRTARTTDLPANAWGAMGVYHNAFGDRDSAVYYLKLQYEHPRNWLDRKNCASALFRHYKQAGQWELATQYAEAYDAACDSMEIENRREATLNADNFFQYTVAAKAEAEKEKADFLQNLLLWFTIIICSTACTMLIVGYHLFKKRMKKMEMDMLQQRHVLGKDTGTMVSVFKKLQETIQNGRGINDVVSWSEIEQCVEIECPDFSERVRSSNLTAEETQICYLARIGMRKTEIGTLLKLSPSTVTRRVQSLTEKGVL